MEFNFDDAFKRHSEIGTKKLTEEIEMIQKRLDEFDRDWVMFNTINSANMMCLEVTCSVFREYHEFLIKTFQGSR